MEEVSGAALLKRAERAMDAERAHLVRRARNVDLLLSPPFYRSADDPGTIKGYVPGVRENAGPYTHAAAGARRACTTRRSTRRPLRFRSRPRSPSPESVLRRS